MVSLKLQKRLAAAVLDCGRRKVWLDPNETSTLKDANSRKAIRRLIKTGYVVRKPNTVHTHWRANKYRAAKLKGRHTGLGKRRGTKEARFPSKLMWIRRIRLLRRILKNYRSTGKIDKHMYHDLYLKCKGNTFKNRRVLLEHLHYARAEEERTKTLQAQAEARREKIKAAKARHAAARS